MPGTVSAYMLSPFGLYEEEEIVAMSGMAGGGGTCKETLPPNLVILEHFPFG